MNPSGLLARFEEDYEKQAFPVTPPPTNARIVVRSPDGHDSARTVDELMLEAGEYELDTPKLNRVVPDYWDELVESLNYTIIEVEEAK